VVGPGRYGREGTFRDRHEAGRLLGERLAELRSERPVVLALPRGGVPVAAEVARALDAPLDVIVVRKLGVPFQPEVGFGAIGEGGAISGPAPEGGPHCGRPVPRATTSAPWCRAVDVRTWPARGSPTYVARPCSSSVVPIVRYSSSTGRPPPNYGALTVWRWCPGATHLFEEPGAMESVARLAIGWFGQHLAAVQPGAAPGDSRPVEG